MFARMIDDFKDSTGRALRLTSLAAGIQIVRAIGIKRLIPILAVGGLALGFLASRGPSSDEAPAE